MIEVHNARRRRTRPAALAGLVMACLLPLPALGQNAPPSPDQPAGAGAEDDRGPGLRDRLQRRLDDILGEQDRLRQAIEMLDQGAPREAALRALRAPGEDDRPGPRDRRNGRRPGGGPDDGRPDRPEAGDRPPPGGDAPGRPREADRLDWRNPAQRERALAFMRENLPELAEKFAALKETNPAMADRIGSRAGPRIMEIMDLRDRDPELAGLKLDELRNGLAVVEAVQQARAQAQDPEKLRVARDALAKRVADQFDIRARLHKHEIEQLRKRLDRLQADLDSVLAGRDDAIQRRTDDMLSGKEKIDLFGGPGRPTGRDGPPERPRDGSPADRDRPPAEQPPLPPQPPPR